MIGCVTWNNYSTLYDPQSSHKPDKGELHLLILRNLLSLSDNQASSMQLLIVLNAMIR